jgi:hypothetical protein
VVVLQQALLRSVDPVQESDPIRRLKNQTVLAALVGSKLVILVFAAAAVVRAADVDGVLVALLGAENYGRVVYLQSMDDSASLQSEA